MPRSIVAPIDGSAEGDRALRVATALAIPGRLPLELLFVDADGTGADEMKRRAADLAPLPCTTTTLYGDNPVAALVDAFAERPDGLVVLGTSARGPLSELLLGSVSEAVLARTDHPLLLVGPNVRAELGIGPALVVAVDSKPTGELLSPAVSDWSRCFGAVPWFVQVTPPMRFTLPRRAGDVSDNRLVHHLADVLRRDGVDAQWDVLHGRSTPDALVDFAATMGGGVVAVASERWADPERIRWASTARSLVHRSRYPVLVVPVHRALVAI